MSTSLIVQHWFDEDLDPPAGAAAQIGQPWYLWRQHPRLDADEDIYRKPNHHSLLTRQIVLVGITINYTVEVPDFSSAEWVDAYEVQKHSLQPFRWYAPTVTSRCPWYLWRPAVLPGEPEEEIRRSDGTLLHRYRTGFQTVGQSYRLWSISKVRLEPEEYAQTRPADLSPFRQITAIPTGGQPWYLWQKAKIDWDIEVQAPKANHDLLHRYRFAFQTVGQSWQYWIKPQARLDDEPNAPARIQDLSPFRTTAPAVQPGQPWFMFPAAEPDLTIDADAVRTDHAAALYPFRPHPETSPPAPVTIELLPAGRHKKYRYFVEIDDQQFQVDSPQEAVLILLQAKDLAPISAERAAKLVLRKQLKRHRRPQINLKPPKIETNAPVTEQLVAIRSDIEAIYHDIAITQELAYLFRKQLQIEQDDDEDVILLLH